jgi:hypothetical protein
MPWYRGGKNGIAVSVIAMFNVTRVLSTVELNVIAFHPLVQGPKLSDI